MSKTNTSSKMTSHDRFKMVVDWLLTNKVARSKTELAKMMHYSPCTFSSYYYNKTSLKDRFLLRLLIVEPRLNLNWVKDGVGEMLNKDDESIKSNLPTEEINDLLLPKTGYFRSSADGRLFLSVRHVSYKNMRLLVQGTDHLNKDDQKFGVELYEVSNINYKNYLSFEVRNNAMEVNARDVFQEGDHVLACELDKNRWFYPIDIKKYPYWVVVFGKNVLLRQMIVHDLVNRSFTFHALNPSPEFKDVKIVEKDIRALFCVIARKPKQVSFEPLIL